MAHKLSSTAQAENTILSLGQVVTINISSDAPNYFLLNFLYILPSNLLKRCLTFYNKVKTVKNKCFRKHRSIIYYIVID